MAYNVMLSDALVGVTATAVDQNDVIARPAYVSPSSTTRLRLLQLRQQPTALWCSEAAR